MLPGSASRYSPLAYSLKCSAQGYPRRRASSTICFATSFKSTSTSEDRSPPLREQIHQQHQKRHDHDPAHGDHALVDASDQLLPCQGAALELQHLLRDSAVLGQVLALEIPDLGQDLPGVLA